VVCALGHVMSMWVVYWFAYGGGDAIIATKLYGVGGFAILSAERKALLFACDMLYNARWAVGCLTTLGTWQVRTQNLPKSG
jgi:hypothetical protein